MHFFTIPVMGGEAEAAALNQFIASNRVIDVERHLIADGGRSLWAFCVTTATAPAVGVATTAPAEPAPTRSRVDYKAVLPPEQFEVFAKLRALRKSIANAEGVPPYSVFNNAQLAAMVQKPARKLADLAAIPGVGVARIKKYGQQFLDALDPEGTPRGEDASPKPS